MNSYPHPQPADDAPLGGPFTTARDIWTAARHHGRLATAALLAAAATIAALAGWLMHAALTALVDGLTAAGDAGAAHAGGVLETLTRFVTGPLAGTIVDPVHHYLHTHTAGLPISSGQAFTCWIAFVAVSWLRGTLSSSLSARIGWAIAGALTIAAVYAGTPGTGKALAAAITAAAWALLSATVYTATGSEVTICTTTAADADH